MSTGHQIPAISLLRAAMEARDVAAVVHAFARDTEIHSSLTAQLTFTGHHQIAAIISVFFDVFDDPRCTDEVHSAGAGYLVSGESRRTRNRDRRSTVLGTLRQDPEPDRLSSGHYQRAAPRCAYLVPDSAGAMQRGAFSCNLTGYLCSGAGQPTALSYPLCDLHHRLITRTITAGLRKERKWG